MADRFARFIVNNSRWIAIVSGVLSIISFYFTALLYMNLKPDVRELLPTTARSVIDLDDVNRRLYSTTGMTVLVFSPDKVAARKFLDDLAEGLKPYVPKTIAATEHRILEEIEFFQKRQALFISQKDLRKIRDFIADRIKYEQELYNPLNIFKQTELPEPVFDFAGLKDRYGSKSGGYDQFEKGYYSTADKKIHAMMVRMPGMSTGIGPAMALQNAVDETIKKMGGPKKYHPELWVQYTGETRNMIEEHHALLEDLGLATTIVMILTVAAMIVFFRTWRGTLALIFSLLTGTSWCFAISYFLIGYLNANSAFLAAIVIGNGINFGIILLARYLDERREGTEHTQALAISIARCLRATWTAAMAAGLAYGSLMLTSFRGFSQFGIIGFIGMMLCWLSAFTTLPALLTIIDKKWPFTPDSIQIGKKYISEAIARLIKNHAKPIVWTSFVFSVLSFVAFATFEGQILETDLTKLRSKDSMETGSGYYDRYTLKVFGRNLSPLVVLADSKENANKIKASIKKFMTREKDLIESVVTLDDFFPPDQKEKVEIVKEIRSLLRPQILQRLSAKERGEAKAYFTQETAEGFGIKDLPPLVVKNFTEQDGSMGKLVLISASEESMTWGGDRLNKFIATIREAADKIIPGAPVAGMLPITSDMYLSVRKDGPLATMFAFLSVIVLVILLFRNVRTVLVALTALLLGVLWLAGLMAAFELRINFLNFIALPITFGIGIDYGVNVFERYRIEGPGSIVRVIRSTGGAVMLASFTTIVGYGSLLLASNQAFNSFGTLAVIGEFTCLFAAILTLPAMLVILDPKEGATLTKSSVLSAGTKKNASPTHSSPSEKPRVNA